jgi:hypothetical protein
MRIVANAFGERAVLKLMYAALIRASDSWRGIQMKPRELKQLDAICEELGGEHDRSRSDQCSGWRSVRRNRWLAMSMPVNGRLEDPALGHT